MDGAVGSVEGRTRAVGDKVQWEEAGNPSKLLETEN